MTLLQIDPDGPIAPFEQVRAQIAAMVANGELMPAQKLPTVRQLAADLGLAPNTVARAYRELEADNIITTHRRRGTFVGSATLDSANRSDQIDAKPNKFCWRWLRSVARSSVLRVG